MDANPNLRILSTKKLAVHQKQFLLNAGFLVVEADFIAVKLTPPDFSNIHKNLIFTSLNAVKSVVASPKAVSLTHRPVFCVGEKTKTLLEQHGFKVMAVADDGKTLSEIIKTQYPGRDFTLFCGNLRLPFVPEILAEYASSWNEIEVYRTHLTPQKVNLDLNGILFFSPSGVESFLKTNVLNDACCFCIGDTTAKALEGYTQNIVVAGKPSVENVIVKCILYFKL